MARKKADASWDALPVDCSMTSDTELYIAE